MKLITFGIVKIRLEVSMDGAGCCDIATTSSPPRRRMWPGLVTRSAGGAGRSPSHYNHLPTHPRRVVTGTTLSSTS
ncbi:hypothetical protein Ate01nite_41400 [Actinoplanes teichomyceticus]|nr:hypothetical protein Ate01nite_41400 [Actinoplanes teichomyceticus]